MTNWMTAAGLALIAGGLATLISFRAVLFRSGQRRAGRRGKRRAGGEPLELTAAPSSSRPDPDGLASLGLADDEPFLAPVPLADDPFLAEIPADEAGFGDGVLVVDDDPGAGMVDDDHVGMIRIEDHVAGELDLSDEFAAVEEEVAVVAPPRPADVPAWAVEAQHVNRADRTYGDRVDGWVRPQYRSLPENSPVDSPAGEYWTPVPDDLAPDPEPSARGYGWPVRVERLPPVPDYEPSTGFDLPLVEHEPTEAMPVWPRDDDRRVRLPRSWSSRNNERRRPVEPPPVPPRRRPRPRPRPTIPAAPASPAADDTQIYVSRHAARPRDSRD